VAAHLARIGAIVTVAALAVVYPFLPGEHDSLAVPLSTMAQACGVFGLPLVPIGILWLVFPARGYRFALAAVIVASFVAIALSIVGFAMVGRSLGIPMLVLCVCIVFRLRRRLKQTEAGGFHPAALYLAIVPVALLLFQLAVAVPMTERSRSRAMTNSAELIGDIEAYKTRNGRFPQALFGLHKDYSPSVIGVERFHYAPQGDAYHLYFEQPRFVLDRLGTQDLVVYNGRDEQLMVGHTARILDQPPERLVNAQGWYEAQEASSPHWKSFFFD
jgi:hypothetical protein